MGRRNDEIKHRQNIIVVVQTAIGVDVNFGACEQADAGCRCIDLSNRGNMLEQPLNAQPVGLHA